MVNCSPSKRLSWRCGKSVAKLLGVVRYSKTLKHEAFGGSQLYTASRKLVVRQAGHLNANCFAQVKGGLGRDAVCGVSRKRRRRSGNNCENCRSLRVISSIAIIFSDFDFIYACRRGRVGERLWIGSDEGCSSTSRHDCV